MTARVQLWVCVAGLLVLPAGAVDAARTFMPAGFRAGDEALAALIEFPDGEHDVDVLLRCDALVSRRGRFMQHFCFVRDDTLAEYVRAVGAAVKRARMNAAVVDGTRRTVWFQYSVRFVRQDGQESIATFPNHGWNSDRYGHDYTGAQRYRWSSPIGTICRSTPNVWVSMTIDEQGRPDDIEFLTDVAGRCALALTGFIKRGAYIPATSNGIPVKARYAEAFFSWVAIQPM